jgi:hypothetical protein
LAEEIAFFMASCNEINIKPSRSAHLPAHPAHGTACEWLGYCGQGCSARDPRAV